MSYLRLIASRRHLRQARQHCATCGRVTFAFEVHCPYCGATNVAFSETLFTALARTTLAEARTQCVSDPEHTLEDIARHELSDAALAWCTICGQRLPMR